MLCKLALLCLAIACSATDPDIYPGDNPTTFLGCTCKGPCGALPTFECSANSFCYVESKDCKYGTADYSVTGLSYYDYCSFPAYPPYETQTAAVKHNMLEEKMQASGGSGSYPSTAGIAGIFVESVNTSFWGNSDVMPYTGRVKYIHSAGVVTPVKWVPLQTQPFKGLFETGSDAGFIRFSSAVKPSSSGVTPGFGLKILRDGKQSANLVAMPTLNSQLCTESTNFFYKNFTNHIPPATVGFAASLLKKKFWQSSSCPQMVGLSDWADGVKGGFPFRITFVPSQKVDCPCGDYETCKTNLQAVTGELFKIYGKPTPTSQEYLIGSLQVGGASTISTFGDENFFVKHQVMEDDFELHPEWLDQIDKTAECGMGCASDTPPDVSSGCKSPFAPPSAPDARSNQLAGLELPAGHPDLCASSEPKGPQLCPWAAMHAAKLVEQEEA